VSEIEIISMGVSFMIVALGLVAFAMVSREKIIEARPTSFLN